MEMNELPYLITLESLEIAIEAVNSKVLYGCADTVKEREEQIEALEELNSFKKAWLKDFKALEEKTA